MRRCFAAVFALVLDHLEDGVDRLLLGGVDEAAGVDDDDLGVFGALSQLGAVVVEKPHHDFGVDEVFGAAERDEADFGADFGENFGFEQGFGHHTFILQGGCKGASNPSPRMIHIGRKTKDFYIARVYGPLRGEVQLLFRTKWRLFLYERFVELDGLGGDGGPGEGGFDAGCGRLRRVVWLFRGWLQECGDGGGEVAGELVGVGGEGGFGVGFPGDEVAGLRSGLGACHDDFEDAAGGGGDDGGLAGHGFEVDDAEGLVDGGAAEDGAVGVELDGFLSLVTICSIQTMLWPRPVGSPVAKAWPPSSVTCSWLSG